MKTHMLVGRLLLGSFVLTGVAAAQVDATHSTEAGTGTRVVHTFVAMRHVGARTTTSAPITEPTAAEAAAGKESATIRVPRLPAVHFRH
jgi:hypothetical protein